MNKERLERRLVSVDEGAYMLGISPWTLRVKCYRGECASNKIGTRLMVPLSEIDRIVVETQRPRIKVA